MEIGRSAGRWGMSPLVRVSKTPTSSRKPRIAISIGDPAGIGPEIALKAARDAAVLRLCEPVLVGSRALLERVAEKLRLNVPASLIDPTPTFAAKRVTPGKVQASNGAAAARWVEAGIDGCLSHDFAALVTCPLHKEALAAGGVPFPGHTELLAHRCGVTGEVMMMYDKKIAVVLATIHQSLRSVPKSLTAKKIIHCGELMADALRRLRTGPIRLAVLGLNPHAGEHGLFGDEDQHIVAPAVAALRKIGIACDGPLPPDTAFTPANRKRYSGYVCCYHDQGLIPFKALAFDDGVNVTLGLPIIRTSVDHGTAFDIAWTGQATHRSLLSAIRLAVKLTNARA